MSILQNQPLKGIIPPMVTPLQNQDTIDVNGMERLIEHLVDGGVHGLFILGTTGEAVSLSYRLRQELIERVCKQVAGRIPVLVGITDSSLTESLQLTEKAAHLGADAVVAAPPYYYRSTQDELSSHFLCLADDLALPLFLYNMPSYTKITFDPETVSALADHQNIIGLKDSSADLIYFQTSALKLKNKTDFTLLVGPEQLLMQTILSGGHGGVNGGANMFPRLYVEMYEAADKRDFERMIPLQERILEISSKIYSLDNSGNGVLKGIKCALSVMDICDAYVARPLSSIGDENRGYMKELLQQLNPSDIL